MSVPAAVPAIGWALFVFLCWLLLAASLRVRRERSNEHER